MFIIAGHFSTRNITLPGFPDIIPRLFMYPLYFSGTTCAPSLWASFRLLAEVYRKRLL